MKTDFSKNAQKRPILGVFCLGGGKVPPKPLKRQEDPFTLILERVLNKPTAQKNRAGGIFKKF